ncbi:oxidoreductase nad-binding domain-containing protein 1 [Diplodia corticola]|uniref:Oxidoreductase nad-binding domain-containing protein 1 n=1 Tax=Diplodia corticola TaxID=236234 RepID=A0A1J9QKE0_9PEZI|nr:oxidoreductase nad-binding domain-containing protein 1 [Diplodia corticola]OJD29334.1 oxidoreductase nad-binding domain-containing protein 1 [Diplodia corticola]
MTREVNSIPHVNRTANEPRDPNLHSLRLAKIDEINATTRLFKLRASGNGVKFLPGQWLDVYLPGVEQAGGFTITSSPVHATPPATASDSALNIDPSPVEQENATVRPYLELAVQKSPNAPAAWLWRPESEILGSAIEVRVGGSFVWPPPPFAKSGQDIQKAVFIAGGVGINPLISIISHLHHTHSMPRSVEFIYTTKVTDGKVLFADRLMHMASNRRDRLKLRFFLTGGAGGSGHSFPEARLEDATVSLNYRRLTPKDILEALGDAQGGQTQGLGADRVLCEKWW